MSSYSLRSPLALWQVSYHTRAKNPYREKGFVFPLRLACYDFTPVIYFSQWFK